MPCKDQGLVKYTEALSSVEALVTEFSDTCEIIVIGDFNASLGERGGPRGVGIGSKEGDCIMDMADQYGLICADMQQVANGPTFTFQRGGIGRSWIDHIF